jgi:hypothetical protein
VGCVLGAHSVWNGEFPGTVMLPIIPAATTASAGPGWVPWVTVPVPLLSFGYGSSMSNSASMKPEPPNSRLVILVFNDSRMFVVGTNWPRGVGLPPWHCSSRSPTSSVIPSTRSITGVPALATQVNACGLLFCCALAVPAPNNRATRANAKNNLRKSAISFSL